MTRSAAIGYAIPWLILLIVVGFSNWQISEVFRTRKIMTEKNSARIAVLEKRIAHLEQMLEHANTEKAL